MCICAYVVYGHGHPKMWVCACAVCYRLMSHHGRGRRPCPFCEDSDFDVTILEHVLQSCSSQLGLHEGIPTASNVDALCTDMFSYAQGFYRVLNF